MALSTKEQTSIDRFRNRVEKGAESQAAIGRSMGMAQSETSALVRGLRKIGLRVETKQPGGGVTGKAKAKAPAKTIIAAKATRKRTNGLHAH